MLEEYDPEMCLGRFYAERVRYGKGGDRYLTGRIERSEIESDGGNGCGKRNQNE